MQIMVKINRTEKENEKEQMRLIQEANELMRIYGSIIEKSK